MAMRSRGDAQGAAVIPETDLVITARLYTGLQAKACLIAPESAYVRRV